MLDPITLLTVIYYGILAIPLIAFYSLYKVQTREKERLLIQYGGSVFVLFVFILIAFRPIGHEGFTDTQMYMDWFFGSKFQNKLETKDIGFGLLIYFSSKVLDVRMFFVLCTLISFGLFYWVSKMIAGQRWFLFFFGCMISLYFWNHQVFTIRQGIASAFFLAAMLQKRVMMTLLLCILSVSFHKSFLLPLVGLGIVSFYSNFRFYLLLWICSIPVSFFFGSEFGEMLSPLLPADIRYYYLPKTGNQLLLQDFRWDVILYSSMFLLVPLYVRSSDIKYRKIVNLYLLTNLFTILLIWPVEGFFHRFGYLSWFLTPLLIYYPILKGQNKINYKNYFVVILFFYTLILLYIGVKIYTQNFKFVPDPASPTSSVLQTNKNNELAEIDRCCSYKHNQLYTEFSTIFDDAHLFPI